MIDLSRYKLTSRKRGGQWSGPCYFTGLGDDRFTIEPHPPEGGPPRWFCRNCNGCDRGYNAIGKSYRYGTFGEEEQRQAISNKPRVKDKRAVTITKQQIVSMMSSMNDEGVAYLESRGINAATRAKFKLGMLGNKFITVPLIYKWQGKTMIDAVKRRWLPQYQPQDRPKYMAIKGSKCRGVFNFDVLRRKGPMGIIANSLFDVMLLDQMGFPVAGPFSGEADWDEKWSGYIQWPTIINLGDFDDFAEDKDGPYRPGTRYMLNRAVTLAAAPQVERIINALPPDGITDITAMWQKGLDVKKWIISLLNREE